MAGLIQNVHPNVVNHKSSKIVAQFTCVFVYIVAFQPKTIVFLI